MSREVDTRVVQMKFDNREFEKNMQETLTSLDQLDEKLQFKGVEDGFEDISNASKKVKLGALGEAVDSVKVKFNALEVAALTVLTNITNKAVNAGERMVKALSVDNIASGWQKFEDTTTSVGTLISQGFNMNEVTEQLERLNWFTDETSYNFTDMVNNISKFTATGQGLEDSVTAMEGIANWAAMSGANAQKASMAMYQLAQAMGKGALKYDDYKSIQNVNMDTREFRQVALDAAEAAGTLKKNLDGTYTTLKGHTFDINSFGTYLSTDAWFTSKAMMQAFKKYASAVNDLYDAVGTETADGKKIETASDAIAMMGNTVDQFGLKAFKAAQEARTWTDVISSVKDAVSSKWKDTFELIVGDYKEAKNLFTTLANMLYNVFAEGGNTRNELLKQWKKDGGREKLLDALAAGYYGLADAINAVKEAYSDIFPEKTSDNIMNVTERFRKFMYWIKMSEPELESVKSLFRGIFGVISDFKEIFVSIVKAIFPSMRSINSFREAVFGLVGALGSALEKFHRFVQETKLSEKIFNSLRTIMDNLKIVLKYAGEALKFVIEKTGDFIESLKNLTPIVAGAGGIATILTTLYLSFKGISKTLSLVFNFVKSGFNVVNVIQDIFFSITSIVNKIKRAINLKIIESTVKNMFFVVASVGILAISLYALSKIDTKDLIKSLITITVLTGVVVGIAEALAVISQKTAMVTSILKKVNAVGIVKIAASVLMVVTAISMLAKTLIKLKDLSFAEIVRGSLAVTALSTFVLTIIGVMRKIASSKANFKFGAGIFASAASLLLTSGAIWLLAMGVINLSKLSTAQLIKGIGTITVLGLVIEALNYLAHKASEIKIRGFGSGLFASSTSLILTAASIAILASVVKSIAQLSVRQIIKAVGVVGALGIFLEAMNLASHKISSGKNKATGLFGSSVSLLITAEAIRVLAEILKDVSSLSLAQIIKGGAIIAGLATVLEIMNHFNHVASKMKAKGLGSGVLASSASLILTAAAIAILGKVVKSLGQLSTSEIVKGIIAVGVLSIFVGALDGFAHKFSKIKGKGIISSSISLVITSASITILANLAKKLGEMPLNQLIKGIGAIGILEVFVIALQKFTKITKDSGFKSLGTFVSSISVLIATLSLSLLVNSVKELATAEGDLMNGVTVLGILTLFVIALSKAIQVLSKIPLTGIPSMLVGVVALGALMLELSLFVPTMQKLAEINSGTLLLSGIAASAIIAVMAMVVVGLGNISLANVVGLIAGVVSIGGLLALINFLVVPALEKLNKVNWFMAWSSVTNMLGILTAIIAVTMGIGTATIAALPAMAAGIIALAVAMGVVASTVIPVITSISELADSLSTLNEMILSDPVSSVIDQIIQAAKTLQTEAPNLEETLKSLGAFTVMGIVQGITDNLKLAEKAGKLIGLSVALGYSQQQIIKSPAEYMKNLAKFSVLGVSIGITNNLDVAKDAGRSLGKAVADGYKETAVVNISDDAVPKASKPTTTNKVSGWSAFKQSVGYLFSKEGMKTQAEIQKNVQSSINSASLGAVPQKVAEKADRNIDKIVKALDATTIVENAVANATTNLADAEKYESEINKYLEQLRKDYNITMEDTNDLMAKAAEATGDYTEALEESGAAGEKAADVFSTLKDTISSQMDIFSEFNDSTDISAQQMLDNMKSQIFGINSWANNLARLSMRGLNADLLKELGDLGPQGYAKVAAFAEMTDEQLQEANYLYSAAMKLPGYAAEEVASSYQYAGELAVKGYSNALDKFKGLMRATELGTVTIQEIDAAVTATLPTLNKTLNTGFKKAADQAKAGFNESMSDDRTVTKVIESFGNKAVATLNRTLEIQSPSRVTKETGKYFAEGFTEGVENNQQDAIDSVTTMAETMINAISSGIDTALNLIQNNPEFQPTLTPILDLSSLQNGESLDSIGTASVDLVAAGFNANMEMVRAMHEQQIAMNVALQDAIAKQSEDLIAAIVSTDKPVNVNVTLQGDAAGLFKIVREQNTKFTKINGYNAFAY